MHITGGIFPVYALFSVLVLYLQIKEARVWIKSPILRLLSQGGTFKEQYRLRHEVDVRDFLSN